MMPIYHAAWKVQHPRSVYDARVAQRGNSYPNFRESKEGCLEKRACGGKGGVRKREERNSRQR